MVLKTCIVSGFTVGIMSAVSAFAAEAPEDLVARCALNVDLSDRVACLESALLGPAELMPEQPEVAVAAIAGVDVVVVDVIDVVDHMLLVLSLLVLLSLLLFII